MYYPRERNSTTVSRVPVNVMDPTPRAASFWGEHLGRRLEGSFTAHASGLLAAEFILRDHDGEEFGRLRLGGASGAEFRSADYAATFEASEERYRMVAYSEEVLSATRGGSYDELVVQAGGRTYETRVSLLRNLAVALYPSSSERAAYLSGGLTSRSYEVFFATEDGCTFPVAIFLLWHVVTRRRRAYRTGGGAV